MALFFNYVDGIYQSKSHKFSLLVCCSTLVVLLALVMNYSVTNKKLITCSLFSVLSKAFDFCDQEILLD